MMNKLFLQKIRVGITLGFKVHHLLYSARLFSEQRDLGKLTVRLLGAAASVEKLAKLIQNMLDDLQNGRVY